jgi:hypothetical protein
VNLQSHYDLEVQRDHVGALIDAQVEVFHHKVA